MNNLTNKNLVFESLIWKFFERTATYGIQFLVEIVLARILFPEDFGLIAIVTIFITIARVFIQRGFNLALIQKKDSDELDFSSMFFLNLFISIILYIIIYFLSPIFASFFEIEDSVNIFRVLSIVLIFGALTSIQNAYISKHMLFHKLFIGSLASIVFSGFIGIFLAIKGYGVWALVIQQLLNQFLLSIIFLFILKWKPKLEFSFSRLKGLINFGYKMLFSALIDTLYIDLQALFIGKIYNPATLGFYNKGKQFPQLIAININSTIQSVLFPIYSANQDNSFIVKSILRRAIKVSTYLVFPLMVGLVVIADPLVMILLTDKWAFSIAFIQILSLSFILYPIQTANLQAIAALGRSDIFLRLEIIKKTISVILLVISIPFGIYYMTWSLVLSSIISLFINSYPNKKLLNYTIFDQFKDMGPTFFLTIIMGLIIYPLRFLITNNYILLASQVSLGITIFLVLSFIFKIDSYKYLLELIKALLNKRHKHTN
jgi:O-antigen/teichoic acid export membrane protein